MNKRYCNSLNEVRRYLADIAYRIDIGEMDLDRGKEVRDTLKAIIQLYKVQSMTNKNNAEIEYYRKYAENDELMRKLLKDLGGK
jgi:ribosomal protein L17